MDPTAPLEWLPVCFAEHCEWNRPSYENEQLARESAHQHEQGNPDHVGDVVVASVPGADSPKWMIEPGISDTPGVTLSREALTGRWIERSTKMFFDFRVNGELVITPPSGDPTVSTWHIENDSHFVGWDERYSVRYLDRNRMVVLQFDIETPFIFTRMGR